MQQLVYTQRLEKSWRLRSMGRLTYLKVVEANFEVGGALVQVNVDMRDAVKGRHES